MLLFIILPWSYHTWFVWWDTLALIHIPQSKNATKALWVIYRESLSSSHQLKHQLQSSIGVCFCSTIWVRKSALKRWIYAGFYSTHNKSDLMNCNLWRLHSGSSLSPLITPIFFWTRSLVTHYARSIKYPPPLFLRSINRQVRSPKSGQCLTYMKRVIGYPFTHHPPSRD